MPELTEIQLSPTIYFPVPGKNDLTWTQLVRELWAFIVISWHHKRR